MDARTAGGFGLTLLIASTFGCASTGALKNRFANERGCPEADVTVVERGGVQYEATGCGQSARYVCNSPPGSADDARRCEESGGPRRPVAEKGTFPPPMPQEQGPK